MLFKISNSFFYTQKVVYFVFKDSSSPVKASNLIRSTPTYSRCIADQTRSKYDQLTLYRRPPRYTPAQHTTCGERDHPRPFFNRLKNSSRSPRPLRAGPTNPRCILDQHTLSPTKTRSLPIRPFFQSGRERGLIGSQVWTGLNMAHGMSHLLQMLNGTSRTSVKVKFGITVISLLLSLNYLEVTVTSRDSKCHVTSAKETL